MSAPQNRDHFQTILVICLGFIGLSFLFKTEILLYIGIGLGVIPALIPVTAQYISLGWYKLGEALGWVNGKVLLSVVFFIFLTPIALIYQWTKKNPLYKKDPGESVFKVREHTFSAKDLRDPW